MKLLWVGMGLGALVFMFAAMTQSEPDVLMHEDFDTDLDGGLAKALLADPEISFAKGGGPDGSDAIRVAYVGYEHGSHRVTSIFNLPRTCTTATLSYDVRFDEGFQFVRGGKLHGLSPKRPISGGQERVPDGWSARVIFREKGYTGSYIYDQNVEKKWGVGGKSREQVFFPGCWHRVDFQIQLNDSGQSNGWSRIFVDGHQVQESTGLEYRSQGGPDSLIQRFLFSTFHGGSTPDCAPVDAQGNPTTIYANFDNFLVIEGVRELTPTSCRDN